MKARGEYNVGPLATVAHFVSADWSKFPGKRSVYSASVRGRRVRRCVPTHGSWNLDALLDLADGLARDGPVVVGVPAGGLERVKEEETHALCIVHRPG